MLQSVDARNTPGLDPGARHDDLGEWPGLGSGLHATPGRRLVIELRGIGRRFGKSDRPNLHFEMVLHGNRLTTQTLATLVLIDPEDHKLAPALLQTCQRDFTAPS